MVSMVEVMNQVMKYAKRTHHELDLRCKTHGTFCMHDLEADLKVDKRDIYYFVNAAIENGGIVKLLMKGKCPLSGRAHTHYRYNKKMEPQPVKSKNAAEEGFKKTIQIPQKTILEQAVDLLEIRKQELVDQIGAIDRTIDGIKKIRL